jgi:uncharacterized damage-inducible protein DinB
LDELSDTIIDRETALANFDHARDDFVRAFAQVSDKALTYKPDGDDYSIGDLLPHVLNQINMYTVVLETMSALGGGLARPFEGESRQEMGDFAARMQAIYAGGEGRDAVTEELEQAHDRLASRLREMAHKEYAQKAPVRYPSSEDPYPTSAADLLAWLTDHYNEHIAQVWQLIEAWEKEK